MPPEQVVKGFRSALTRIDVEQFVASYLDDELDLLGSVVVSTGDEFHCVAKFKDIWGPLKDFKASSIVCGHTHVLPIISPSRYDMMTAVVLQDAAKEEGINLIDCHYVFFPTDEKPVNFVMMIDAKEEYSDFIGCS